MLRVNRAVRTYFRHGRTWRGPDSDGSAQRQVRPQTYSVYLDGNIYCRCGCIRFLARHNGVSRMEIRPGNRSCRRLLPGTDGSSRHLRRAPFSKDDGFDRRHQRFCSGERTGARRTCRQVLRMERNLLDSRCLCCFSVRRRLPFQGVSSACQARSGKMVRDFPRNMARCSATRDS